MTSLDMMKTKEEAETLAAKLREVSDSVKIVYCKIMGYDVWRVIAVKN